MQTNSVLDALSAFRREIGRIYVNEARNLDMGPKQMMFLYKLSRSNATLTELAESTLTDKASATRIVAALEKSGFVKRVEREGDKRVSVIQLTSAGRSKAAKAAQIREVIETKVKKALSASDRTALASLLEKASVALEKERLNQE